MSNFKRIIFSILCLNCLSGSAKTVNILDCKKDNTAYWDQAYIAASEAAGTDGGIIFPAGTYKLKREMEIKNSITIIMQGGKIITEGETLFRIISGKKISFIGEGQTTLLENVNAKTIKNGSKKIIPSIIDVEHVKKKAVPAISISNLDFKAYSGINGMQLPDKGEIENLTVKNCKFTCKYGGIVYRHSKINSLLIQNCHFCGGCYGIRVMSPIPNGARVENNILKNIGITAIRLSGGRVNQVSQGCARDMMSAVVHGNQIIDSSDKHSKYSYVNAVLVYGYNISIQNNIVQNFNRGERIPGREKGNRIKLPDGTYTDSPWLKKNGSRKRIAGAALYAKGRNIIISNNICSNSGFRAVIEIKTAGLEPYAIVSGNILDGSSLAVHESYGIECLTSKAIWSNNLLYNMPNTAFALRSLMKSTFLNNVISDSRSAFLIDDSGNHDELIAGNRLINVKYKFIDIDGKPVASPQISQSAPPTMIINSNDELPPPNERNHGQTVIIRTKNSDNVLICVYRSGKYSWKKIEMQNQLLYPSREPQTTGENIITNPELKPDPNNKKLPASWKIWAEKVAPEQLFKYDNNILCGGAMDVGKTRGYSWRLSQTQTLKPGQKYCLKATVKVDSDLTYAVLSIKNHAAKSQKNKQWETLSINFQAPESGKIEVALSGRQCGNEKKVWIKGISLYPLK